MGLSAAAFGVTVFLESHGIPNLFLLFLVAIGISTAHAGPGPGILATVLCTPAAALLFHPPLHSFAVERLGYATRLFLFSLASLSTLALTAGLRRSWNKATQALREKEQILRTLENRVAERTAALEAFTYSIAHDLRGPLRAMRGFADVLLEEFADRLLDRQGREYLHRISEGAERMDALINDLLTYSRLGRQELDLAGIDPGQALEQVLADLQEELRKKGARVDVRSPLPPVLGHAVTLPLVLTNLVSNAVKFVPSGKRPEVRIWGEEGDGRVRLWVEDNGIGIASEHHERIFRVFERLNRPEEYAGTGMGLAIVRKAVERMGGQVGVKSEPGRGSRFWVELRAAETAIPLSRHV